MSRRDAVPRLASSLLLAGLVAGCSSAPPLPTTPVPSSSPAGSASAPASPRIGPGQPYTGIQILEAMRSSRRPGGVPDSVETVAVSDAIAEALWTLDGQPWDAHAIGGSCGPTTCSVEVTGTREDADGEDLWVFAVDPETSEIELVTADLGAIPRAVVADLDELTQSLGPDGALAGLPLAGVRWLAPPDDGTFALAYRAGDEEGSCEVDVVLDAVRRTIVDSTSTNC